MRKNETAARAKVGRLALGGVVAMLIVPWLGGCETIKPYEKEYLLNPLMDDAGVASLSAPLMTAAAGGFERLGAGAGAAGGTSCPTCGG